MAIDRASTAFDGSPRTAAGWIWTTAVVMSLGWGLRGYIGGGPLGAMIPGVLVTVLLCQYLGFGPRAAAVTVAFGTLGIAFGGEMTYGQTLGLLRHGETFWWGLTGTTLKGAIWGLLGGAMLGLGFVARHITWRHLLLSLACLLVGVILGIHFINQPKLIYFSDPVNRPRDESWAGFLFGAMALLAYLRAFQPAAMGPPARFALFGMLGGAVGFGGGSLLLALRFQVGEPWHWLPYWKFMEFTFGFLLGGALGGCAWQMRDVLRPLADSTHRAASLSKVGSTAGTQARRWMVSLLTGAAIVGLALYGWEVLDEAVSLALQEGPKEDLRQALARVLLGFTGLGCLLLVLSRASDTVAWQTSISVTIVAAAIDWQRDLLPRGQIDMPASFRLALVIGVAALCVHYVAVWQQRKAPRLMDLFLFAVVFLMVISSMTALARADLWWPDAGAAATGDRAATLWREYRSEIVVHAIFLTLALLSVLAALRARKAPASVPASGRLG